MNYFIHIFIVVNILTQITASSRKTRAIAFECEGDALSPIVIDQIVQTNRFSDFIQTKTHDAVPNEIKLTKHAEMGYFRLTLGSYTAQNIPRIIGGPLNQSYTISHVDFHWGEHNGVGSEHIVGYIQYPMEIRAVYRAGKYSSITEAYQKSDGIAIVSYLVKASTTPNAAIGRLLEKFQVLANPGTQTVALTYRFGLSKLLGYFRDDYYTYVGSYTKFDVKQCSYNVRWIIPRQPIEISDGQLRMFRSLAEKSPLFLNNWSDVEPLNNRTVYYQKKDLANADCACENRIDIRIEK